MPIELVWHPTLPVLIATYSGDLNANDHRAMTRKRAAMIAKADQPVVLLADVRALGSFEDATKVAAGEHVLRHANVICTLVVLGEEVYHRWSRAILSAETRYHVLLFPTMDQALAAADVLLAQ